MTDPRLTCPICMHREAGLIPAPRHVSAWDDLTGPEQMAMLAEVGAALGRGTVGFVASSDHDHFHLREANGTRLTTGGRDPLLPLLAERLDTAHSVDLAIAFAMDSGVALLEPWFRELLARGGRLRIVVGDYLDTTDPTALARLLDLEGAELFVFETGGLSFHPKAWLFRAADARGAAIVGSSNLSQSALTDGVEWNLHSEDAADSVGAAFEDLLARPEVKPLTAAWVDAYAKRRRTRPMPEFTARVVAEEGPPPEPHTIQQEALAALAQSRSNGYRAGLVVLATGLGKTWLAAFDTIHAKAGRILFVAHRDEILTQAMAAFRKVRPDAKLVPEIGTVLMLRPTESAIIWLQQLGRGLRRVEGKVLQVIDYIGNHRSFLTKVATLLQAGAGDRSISTKLEALQAGEFQMPKGCEITYELEVIDILRNLLRPKEGAAELEAFYVDFRDRNGIRPTAVEVFRNGFDPRTSGHGGWFDFVRDMGDPLAERPFATHGRLLRELERPRGLSRSALTGLRDVVAGRQPSEGASELDFNPHLAKGGNGFRLARPDYSGELEPLVCELVEWRLAETPIVGEAAEASAAFVGKPQALELWRRYYVPDITEQINQHMAKVRKRGELVRHLDQMNRRIEDQSVQDDLFDSAEALQVEVNKVERQLETGGLQISALQEGLADALAPYVVRRQRDCIGESADRKTGAFVYPTIRSHREDTALSDQQRQIIERIKALAECITTGVTLVSADPQRAAHTEIKFHDKSRIHIRNFLALLRASITFAREEWARERDSEADQRGRTEPPRVYRRVSGSMIRLLFRQHSSLRRRPPLLLWA